VDSTKGVEGKRWGSNIKGGAARSSGSGKGPEKNKTREGEHNIRNQSIEKHQNGTRPSLREQVRKEKLPSMKGQRVGRRKKNTHHKEVSAHLEKKDKHGKKKKKKRPGIPRYMKIVKTRIMGEGEESNRTIVIKNVLNRSS